MLRRTRDGFVRVTAPFPAHTPLPPRRFELPNISPFFRSVRVVPRRIVTTMRIVTFLPGAAEPAEQDYLDPTCIVTGSYNYLF